MSHQKQIRIRKMEKMKSKCCNLNNNYLSSKEIDFEHKIESVVNDCKVTIYFINNRNDKVERNVLENLLDTFENRMKAQINC